MRLDTFLSNKGMASSRSRAANLVELGRVTVNDKVVTKSSYEVKETDVVNITEDYDASLGGMKLSKALDDFGITVKDKICLDVGASNGGFTDILLKYGAKLVYALDVGECALPDYLKDNKSVVVMDRTNARFLNEDTFDIKPDFAVIDVSFISLTLILASVASAMTKNYEMVALIKPQFECSKKDLSKKGILIDAKKREKAVNKVIDYAKGLGLSINGITEAPHPFKDKNQEYLLYLKKS